MVVVVVVPRRPLRPEGQIWAIERVPGRGGFVLCAFSDSDCPIQSDSNIKCFLTYFGALENQKRRKKY